MDLLQGACLCGLSLHRVNHVTSCTINCRVLLPQGVEPELYAPAELLSGRGVGLASGLGGGDSGAAERDPTRPHTWFSNLFNGGAAGGSADNLHRDSRGAATASASALDHPPQVPCGCQMGTLPCLCA